METKHDLVASITELAQQFVTRLAEEDVDEQTYMREQCSVEAQKALETISVEALHLLDEVPHNDGDSRSVNVSELSEVTGVPKGTVSKRIQRLANAGVVTRHQMPGNRKEVHLRLTALGEEIWAAHRSLHEQMGTVIDDFLARYSEVELEVLRRVLHDLVRMPREGIRFRPDLLE